MHRSKGIAYVMEFQITEALPSEYYLRFEFQHPKRGGSPISELQSMEEKGGLIRVTSEIFDCARSGARLSVGVGIFADSDFKTKLGEHKQPMVFGIPKEVLQQFGIPRC